MKRLMLVALLLAPSLAFGQGSEIDFKPAQTSGPATTVAPGVTGIAGCTNQFVIADGSSLINCDAGLVYDAGTVTVGADMVTNGTFTGNATGWTLGGGGGAPDWAYAFNNVTHGNGGGTTALQPSTPLVIVAGHRYRVSFALSSWVAGSVTPSIGGTSGSADGQTGGGTFTQDLVATDTSNLKLTPTNDLNTTLDTVSVKEITNSGFAPAVRSSFYGQVGLSGSTNPTNVEIGSNANDAYAGKKGGNVIIGNGSTNSGDGSNNTCVGTNCAISGGGSVGGSCLGQSCTISSTGSNNTALGNATTISGSAAGAICLGSACASAASNSFTAGSVTVPTNDWYGGKGQTSTAATAFTLHGTGGSGNDNAGGALKLAGGFGTGTAAGGDVAFQRSPSVATGSTAQTATDAIYIRSQKKTLADGAATAVARISVPQGVAGLTGWTGGTLYYTVVANDATNYQAHSGSVNFAFVNEAGTEACTNLGTVSSIADATPTGTLTATISGASNAADTCDLLINAASSLTESTLAAFWSITLNGPGTVTPQ